ncbi:MAG: tRNA pseudouridine(38-40) synthase TruA [Candidatus Rokubacteria bacterium]|nr:tRNA pseudouridine(38-40) synthase TruA [Candidatus Rokubacteria bacterium]
MGAPQLRTPTPPARIVRLELAYDGTAYAGWQVQPDVPTVQGTVLAAARTVLGDPVKLTGASRTDAGVHALRQVASLTTGAALPAASIARALNATLPADVRVLEACEAPADFDARRHARGKRYAYLLDTGRVAAPLLRRYAWHVPQPLALEAMRAALAAARGAHDFSAFCAAPGRHAMPVCHVRAVHVRRRKHLVAIVIGADRFLHHMVRNLVGSAVAVARGAHDPAWFAAVLAGRDRRAAGVTAPAHGLSLIRVLYLPVRCA